MKKKKQTKQTSTTKSLFDHVNAIYADQSRTYFDGLNTKDLGSYNQYMINRFLSMNPVQTVLVNEIQKFGKVPNRAHYLFFTNVIPKRRQFNKYIKKEQTEYPEWILELLMKHYKTSMREVLDYMDIFTMNKKNMDDLKNLCRFYAIEEETIEELDSYGKE
jgi:hypothetical protein